MEQAYCKEWINDELECNTARKADEENRREGYHPADVELVASSTIASMNHDELCRKNYVGPAHCEEYINDELERKAARKADEENAERKPSC